MTHSTDMITRRCQRCGAMWSTNTAPYLVVINNFCPTCIPAITHVLHLDRPTVAETMLIRQEADEALATSYVNALRAGGTAGFIEEEKRAIQNRRRTA